MSPCAASDTATSRRPRATFKALSVAALLIAAAQADFGAASSQRLSGYDFMSPETRAMQDDDFTNPATLWVLDGETLWNRRLGMADRACADCHGDARSSMKGVSARYPAWDSASKRPLNLEQRINSCRITRQKATPLEPESAALLALTAYVGRQSRGLPIAIPDDDRLSSSLRAGREIFFRRQGQLNLACAQCHDESWGKKLAGITIPQAHPTGYPLYRLEWQTLGSLQRRLRNCMIGIRAEPYSYGAPEMVDLELYLMWRARGMKVETPAVRP